MHSPQRPSPRALTTAHLNRRLLSILALAALLGALAAMLTGPSQTLARTRRSSCATHAKHKCPGRTCASSRKGRRHRTVKCSTKSSGRGRRPKSGARALAPAYCADGSVPTLSEGAFACDDGSQPQCEDGATPTARGSSLVCPLVEEEASSGEAECEEEESCSGSGEPAPAATSSAAEAGCEGSAGEFAKCEAES